MEQKRNLLKTVLQSVTGLDYIDDKGNTLSPAKIVASAIDNLEISRVLLEAYNTGLEKKMQPKKATSDNTPDTGSPAALEA
ncbi:MAG: hypothetical protein AB7D03_02070 [Thiomicrospira sp.]